MSCEKVRSVSRKALWSMHCIIIVVHNFFIVLAVVFSVDIHRWHGGSLSVSFSYLIEHVHCAPIFVDSLVFSVFFFRRKLQPKDPQYPLQ